MLRCNGNTIKTRLTRKHEHTGTTLDKVQNQHWAIYTEIMNHVALKRGRQGLQKTKQNHRAKLHNTVQRNMKQI